MENLRSHINLINAGAVTALARSYNVLNYTHNLREILTAVIPEKDFSNYTKFQLHRIINEILTSRYNGENAMKAKLVKMFVAKKVTAAFEIRVNNSRVDFLKVNGDTVSYEIKSGIDNLNKLSKQVSDYEKVFEFNYIVIDEKHLKAATELIPEHYGIYVANNEKLLERKKAKQNCCLEPEMQLQLFTKKELGKYFKNVQPIVTEVVNKFTAPEINENFKLMLKKRYEKRWDFLKQNMEAILPIDYQYFFQHNIQPKVIYGA